MTKTQTAGHIAHDMLAADVALLYRWGVTPEGEGMRLDRTEDGWTDAETGRTYATVADAYADADAAL